MTTYPAPVTCHPPKEETFRLALGLLLARQGWDSAQIDRLLIRLPAQTGLFESRYPLADQSLPDAERQASDMATYERLVNHRTARRQREIEQHLMAELDK